MYVYVYVKRSKSVGGIESELTKEYEKQTNYWREVLKRVAATVKLLATLGLGFREHDSLSKENSMSCLEYVAEFDIFLKNSFRNLQQMWQRTCKLSFKYYARRIHLFSGHKRKKYNY
jgi:hypothetical protein